MNNEHKDFSGPLPDIVVDLSEWAPKGGGRSDYVPDGNYELETVGVELVERKEGGRNLKYTDMVVGPEGKGATIYTYHPAPIGDDKKVIEAAYSWIGTRLNAYCSHSGKDPAGFKKELTLNESTFKGKKFFGTLRAGSGDFANSSSLEYRTRAQYEAAPGKFAESSRPAAASGKTSKAAAALNTETNGATAAAKTGGSKTVALDI